MDGECVPPTPTPTLTPFIGNPPYVQVGVQANCFSSGDSPVPYIYKIDPVNGAYLAQLTVTSGSLSICGIAGLCRNPLDKKLYAIASLTDSNTRKIITINESTGVATTVGTASGAVGLAITSSGRIFITKKSPSDSTVLFEMTLPSTLTERATIGAWCEESIAFNDEDGLLYGQNNCDSSNYVLVDLTTYAVSNVPAALSSAYGALGPGGPGMFYGSDGFATYQLSRDFSSYTLMSSFPFPDGGRAIKGLVFNEAFTPTITPTITPSPTITRTHTVSPTPTRTDSPTMTETPTFSTSPTVTATFTITQTFTATETPCPTCSNNRQRRGRS